MDGTIMALFVSTCKVYERGGLRGMFEGVAGFLQVNSYSKIVTGQLKKLLCCYESCEQYSFPYTTCYESFEQYSNVYG